MLFECSNNAFGIVHRQRGLGNVGQMIRCFHLQFGDVLFGFDQVNPIGDLTHRAFDFRMAFMTNHDDFKTAFTHAFDFNMYLGHQRTGRIENMQIAALRLGTHRERHAMCGKNHGTAVRRFVQLLNEHRAFIF